MDALLYDAETAGGGHRLWRRDANGTRTVIGPTVTAGVDECWFPRVTADGARVAFVRGNHEDYSTTDLWTAGANGAGAALLVDASAEGWDFLATPHWHPSGDQLVVARAPSGGAARPTVIDASSGAVVGDLDFDAGAALTDPSWHPNPDAGGAGIARCIYIRDGSIVDRYWDGAAPVGARNLILDAATVGSGVTLYDPQGSPTGFAILSLCDFNGLPPGSPSGQDWGLLYYHEPTSSWARLDPGDYVYGAPTWSLDGLYVYSYRFTGTSIDLVRLPNDGSAASDPGAVDLLYGAAGVLNEYPTPLPFCLAYADSFDRDDGAVGSTDGGGLLDPAVWRTAAGGISGLEVIGNTVAGGGGATSTAGLLPSLPALQTVTARIVGLGVSASTVDIVARWVRTGTALDYHFVIAEVDEGGGLSLIVRVPPAAPVTVGAGVVVAEGDLVTLRCDGTAVEAYVGEPGSEALVATATDPLPVPGRVGLGFFITFDDPPDGVRVAEFAAYGCASEHAPVADDGSASTLVDVPVATPLVATDADGDTLAYILDTLPAHGTLSGTFPALTYTPDAGYVGPDEFTWHANDGTFDSNVATFTLSVSAVPVVVIPPPPAPYQLAALCNVAVTVTRRGSRVPLVSLEAIGRQPTTVAWSWALDEVTTARLEVPSGHPDAHRIADLRPLRDEVHVYRDDDEVWTGPLVSTLESPDGFTLEARDLSWWLWRRRLRLDHRYLQTDLAYLAGAYANDALAADPVGLAVLVGTAGVAVDRDVFAATLPSCGRQLEELTAAGLDWYSIGRAVQFGSVLDGVPSATLRDADFAGPVTIGRDGLAYASDVLVRGEGDVLGHVGGTDPVYGLAEVDFDQRDVTDQAAADVAAYRRYQLRGAAGIPLTLTLPDALEARAPVSLDDLTPGRLVRVEVAPACSTVAVTMRVVGLTVEATGQGETVRPVLELPGGTE